MSSQMLIPSNIEELKEMLLSVTDKSNFIAGGTDLTIAINEGKIEPDLLIVLSSIPEMLSIKQNENLIVIGASVCFSELAKAPLINKYFPALASAAAGVGSKQIRNMGTIGGNIANASPAGDMLPPLICLAASVLILDRSGKMLKKDIETLLSDGLAVGEVIISVMIPITAPDTYNCFLKLGTRQAVSIARLSVAVNVQYSDKTMNINNAVVVVGALGKKPITSNASAQALNGQTITYELGYKLAEALTNEVDEAIPGRYSQPYKREAVKGLAFDVIGLLSKKVNL